MKKIILNIAVSLDSFIEGPNGEFDWCFADQDYGMKDFMENIDTIFFGRKSYELVLNMDKNPYPKKMKYIFSKTMSHFQGNVNIISSNIKDKVKNILGKPGKNIWLFGGSSLISSLVNLNLVDEIQLAVHPTILGKGKPLFEGINERKNLKLINTKTYSSGLVQLFYQFDKK